MGIFVVKTFGAFISRRIQDSILIEPLGNSVLTQTFGNEPGKNIPHYLGGLLVNNQGVFILRVLGVAVWSKGPDELPVLPFVLEGPPHIGGGLVGVLLVHEAGDTDFQTVNDLRVQERVNPWLIEGDKTGVVERDRSEERRVGKECRL